MTTPSATRPLSFTVSRDSVTPVRDGGHRVPGPPTLAALPTRPPDPRDRLARMTSRGTASDLGGNPGGGRQRPPVAVQTTGRRRLTPKVTTISMQASAYTPQAPAGGTDDYHCTLVNPHVKPKLVHRLQPVLPEQRRGPSRHPVPGPARRRRRQASRRSGGKGWTCFGESALPGTGLTQIAETPWLTAWAPGHGEDMLPAGTGVKLPGRKHGHHADPLQPAAG